MNCFSMKTCRRSCVSALLLIALCGLVRIKSADAYSLTINNPGNGGGNINGAIVCTIGPLGQCIGDPLSGSVTVLASPDTKSLFAGWGPPCSSTASECTFTLLDNTVMTATFNPDYRVGISHNVDPTYATITDAYADYMKVDDQSTIWTTVDTIIENVTLDRAIFIYLVGGTNGGLPTVGYTTIEGTLDASVGSVQIDKFIVKYLVVSGGSVEALSLIIQ